MLWLAIQNIYYKQFPRQRDWTRWPGWAVYYVIFRGKTNSDSPANWDFNWRIAGYYMRDFEEFPSDFNTGKTILEVWT